MRSSFTIATMVPWCSGVRGGHGAIGTMVPSYGGMWHSLGVRVRVRGRGRGRSRDKAWVGFGFGLRLGLGFNAESVCLGEAAWVRVRFRVVINQTYSSAQA